MNRVLVATLSCVFRHSAWQTTCSTSSPSQTEFHAATAKPAYYKVNCNAATISSTTSSRRRHSHLKPSAARALIDQDQNTAHAQPGLPLVVNTHFHWDHHQGNEAYPSLARWRRDWSSEATSH